MDKAIFLMDVGGTNTRIKIIQMADDLLDAPVIIASRSAKIQDKQVLSGFISDLITETGTGEKLELAVFCFAGPISGRGVSMINWPPPRDIGLDVLEQIGLPEDRIILLNDMEAAAFGLVAYKKNLLRCDQFRLYPGTNAEDNRNDHSLLMIPGTGIGISGLVSPVHEKKEFEPIAMSCETQHAVMPELDEQHRNLLNIMKKKQDKPRLSWEDLVSGKGLENIYYCLFDAGLTPEMPEPGLKADDIAQRVTNDSSANLALNIYYQCTGALAQVLALTFQPYGGIYVAGASTRQNHLFIPDSPFLTELHKNTSHSSLLKAFPVYLIKEELNLHGAAYVANLNLRSDQLN